MVHYANGIRARPEEVYSTPDPKAVCSALFTCLKHTNQLARYVNTITTAERLLNEWP